MIELKITQMLKGRCCTLLGVGPMSRNCVDAAVELANELNVLIILVASRRQIEAASLGRGYVNNWTTREFSDYIFRKDLSSKVILARDHGGPWQGQPEIEGKVSLRQAMENAKASFKEDIDAGFEILHLDPSVDVHATASDSDIIERLFDLLEYCHDYACKKQKKIIFEIGTDEQHCSSCSPEKFENMLKQVFDMCSSFKLPVPRFVVAQTGTKVMETRNIGYFNSPVRIPNMLPVMIQVPKIIEICRKFNIYMKQHNTDYLDNDSLKWHPKLGIHSANVAPEFGVCESKALLRILGTLKMQSEADRFLKLSYDSGKWKKWLLPDSALTNEDKAVISGHYIFSLPDIQDIKNKADSILGGSGKLDLMLKAEIKQSILRYLKNFKLVE